MHTWTKQGKNQKNTCTFMHTYLIWEGQRVPACGEAYHALGHDDARSCHTPHKFKSRRCFQFLQMNVRCVCMCVCVCIYIYIHIYIYIRTHICVHLIHMHTKTQGKYAILNVNMHIHRHKSMDATTAGVPLTQACSNFEACLTPRVCAVCLKWFHATFTWIIGYKQNLAPTVQ